MRLWQHRTASRSEFVPGACHGTTTHILLLLMHVTNLEPNVLFTEWARRVGDDVLEAL